MNTKKISSAIYLPTLQTLAFRLHAFWPYFSGRMPSELLILGVTHLFTQASDPRSVLTIWTPICWVHCWPNGRLLTAIGLTKHQGAVLAASNESCILPPVWWFQRPKALCRSRTLPRNHASYWPRLELAIGWPSHQLTIVRL